MATLNAHGVEYVVIGAFAALAQGAPVQPTYDVDVTPRRTPENMERLSGALTALGARIRVDDLEEGLAFDHSAVSISGMEMLNLTCEVGSTAHGTGPPGGEDQDETAVVIERPEESLV